MGDGYAAFQRLPVRLRGDGGAVCVDGQFADPDEPGERAGVWEREP